MKLDEIDKLIQKESRWELKNELQKNKFNTFLIKTLSFFSILFSLSIINELSLLGLETYLVIIFGIFSTLLIVINEFIKVNKLITLFSLDKSTENIILSIITVLLSIIVSTYGIYKFLDRSDKNAQINDQYITDIINDTTNHYNNEINNINILEITDIEPFKSKYEIYNNQLSQYKLDRDNYKNKNMTYNNNLRDFYVDINEKIDKANENIVQLNVDFNEYKNNKINQLNKLMTDTINDIKIKNEESQINLNNKNYIIILLFIFFTILTEIGIIYISIKIANTNKENLIIKEYNNKVLENKISFIKNTKEYKQYELYKNVIEKLCSTKPRGSSITMIEFKTILNNYNLTTNQINHLINEFKTIGIISQPIRRIGSKVELDMNESINLLRKYYEPSFKQY